MADNSVLNLGLRDLGLWKFKFSKKSVDWLNRLGKKEILLFLLVYKLS